MTFLLEIVKLGLSNLRRHALRSLLTALGIIFGVAAVITNAAIGEGSKREALAQIEALGAKNIIIRSTKPPESASGNNQRRSWTTRYGLTRMDLAVLKEEFEGAEAIVPLKAVGGQVLRENLRRTSQAFGTTPDLKRAANLRVARGRYLTEEDLSENALVCVVGHEVARLMFPFDDPLGETIGIDSKRLRIVGVLEPVGIAGGAGGSLVGRDLNMDVHLPITTANEVFGDSVFRATSGSMSSESVQVSEVYVVAPTRDEVMQYAQLVTRVMESRRPGLTDVTIIVPYELLEGAKKAALTWNLVLTFIAGISLLVGGIGIMNIMLASVTERTREIGIRRALGATRKHIVWQFLVETGVLSALGGLCGVLSGVTLALALGWLVPRLHELPLVGESFKADAKLPTALTPWSIMVAFIVAALTGLLFGLYPAVRASKQDPIVALRHD
ncbi:MAG: ABC transporter permease [Phycisphaerales bacterium]|nr:ABC transporter permease [Phycisphaerales bacterium]